VASPAPASRPTETLEARSRARLGQGLPLPGRGDTLGRWRALAAIGAEDLALAKVLEAHHDALAILAELDAGPPPPGTLLAVWAAEGPESTVTLREGPDGEQRQLVLVDLRQPEGGTRTPGWDAVGMSAIESGPIDFESVPCRRIGAPGAYLARPGFWHGGAGVAACWLGAAIAIAQRMADPARVERDPHLAAALGRVDMALGAAAALLRELAARIDADPGEPHLREVVRLRSVVERAGHDVLDAAARTMGPGPLCLDREHAQRCADLSVFVRQSHADRDWAALGREVAMREAPSRWAL
jgi:hypothetical protein